MRTGALFAVLWLSSSLCGEAKDTSEHRARLLTRSLYVPVEIALCGHLQKAVLYQDGQAVGLFPAKRIFQFTYYPDLSRVEPVRSELRVEGLREDGSHFSGRLIVTPWGVFTARYRIELDLEEQLEKMKFQLDVRHRTVTVRVRCTGACGRARPVESTRSSLEQ